MRKGAMVSAGTVSTCWAMSVSIYTIARSDSSESSRKITQACKSVLQTIAQLFLSTVTLILHTNIHTQWDRKQSKENSMLT